MPHTSVRPVEGGWRQAEQGLYLCLWAAPGLAPRLASP